MYSKEKFVSTDSKFYLYTPTTIAQKLYFYPTYIGSFEYEPGYSLYRDSYDSFLVMIISAGSCNVKLKDATYIAKKNDIIFLNCYEPHQYSMPKGCKAYWFHFDGTLALEYYKTIITDGNPVITPRNIESILHQFHKMYQVFCSDETLNEPMFSIRIQRVLHEFINSKKELPFQSDDIQNFSDVISYINEHFADDLSLDILSNYCSLSPYYFCRLFTREIGMSPHQYVLTTRINYAKFQLKNTKLSIKDIAFQSGFSNESSFCNNFRKREKKTPSQFRQNESTFNL